jgi:hypothetical protein
LNWNHPPGIDREGDHVNASVSLGPSNLDPITNQRVCECRPAEDLNLLCVERRCDGWLLLSA